MPVDPEELRASLAATDSIEALFIDEICTASRLLAELRENRPEGIDPGWMRRYSQYQNMFHRGLKALETHRKFKAAHPDLYPPERTPDAEPDAELAADAPPPSPASLWELAGRVSLN